MEHAVLMDGKLIQFNWIADRVPDVFMAVGGIGCGADRISCAVWRGAPEYLCSIPAEVKAELFCSVKEALPSFHVMESVVALLQPCITVFARTGKTVFRKIRTAWGFCRRILGSGRQRLFRMERRVRL